MKIKGFVPYERWLKEVARRLRNESTLSETLLWNELKKKQMLGFDFHRQRPIDRYVVDFYCPRLNLAIEIDGESHATRILDDARRQARLEELGITFLRFTDDQVKFEMDVVLGEIRGRILDETSLAVGHTPPRGRGAPLSRGDSAIEGLLAGANDSTLTTFPS